MSLIDSCLLFKLLLTLIPFCLQMAYAYDLVHYPQFPSLKVIKTHTGNIFVGAKSAVQVLSGQSEDSASVKLSMYIRLHYPSHVFVDVNDPAAATNHVCWYKVQSGQSAYAFSVAGLENLCKNLPGFVSFKKKSEFMELIEEFKNSLSHKRPRCPSGEGLPNPKRAAIDPVDPFAAEGDGGIMGNPDMISLDCLNQIIRGKDAQIERLKTISDNVVALMKEMKETNAKIDRLQSSFDTINASLKTLIDLLLPGT